MTFLSRQEYVEKEPGYPWRDEVPGMLHVKLAPQMWVWMDANFTPQQAKSRFCGFIECLVFSPNTPLPDLRKLMERIEETIHDAKEADRPAMLALYWLFNATLPEQYCRPNWLEFLTRYDVVLSKCSIECMTALLVGGQHVPWPLDEVIPVVEQYLKTRYKPTGVRLPLPVELALLCHVANLHLAMGNRDEFRQWVNHAVLDAAGRKATQELLRQHMDKYQPVDIRSLVGWSPVPAGGEQPAVQTGQEEPGQQERGEALNDQATEVVTASARRTEDEGKANNAVADPPTSDAPDPSQQECAGS
jgi:hypothetical protein